MQEISKSMQEREKYLLKIKKAKEKSLMHAPNGLLRVSHKGGRIYYYKRENPKDSSGVYISNKDIVEAERLAQKDYDKKVLQAVEKELSAIEKYKSNYPKIKAEAVYESLHEGRQRLIMPIIETDEDYVRNWESVEYVKKGFPINCPELYTAKGERVRSKSEVIIADTLYREGVPYRYEYPLYLEGSGIIHPDFTVLNVSSRKEMYLEHLGMMDDPEYAERALQRIENYENNNIWLGERLIITYETSRKPLNQKQIMKVIQHYFR